MCDIKDNSEHPFKTESLQIFAKAVSNFGCSVREAAKGLNDIALCIKKMEETDPVFKAQMDSMRFRCLPWYKRIWRRKK